ncbi:hypothetical protein NM688_g4590 [Phlebia brevispora]|uniref:Uncharacterized protein n=1 Tax=Phlebia brevispora TaxID=194682 RepID=A0ACC1T2I4_9APHY|nr:hypothetical protein NM688_g4590 [Phlebia brevispora]
MRLSTCCRDANEAVHRYIRSTLDVNRLLRPFFTNAVAFRNLQARAGMLISGSAVLQFFLRIRRTDSTLVLYIYVDQLPDVTQWLLQAGYRLLIHEFRVSTTFSSSPDVSRFRNSPGLLSQAVNTLTFKRKGASTTINVVSSPCLSPIQMILLSRSTGMLNLVTQDMAYCMYPRATLEGRCSLLLQCEAPAQQATKEDDRIPDLQYIASAHQSGSMLTFRFGQSRWLNDRNSWSVPLDTILVTVPCQDDGIQFTSWRLMEAPQIRLAYEAITYPCFRRTYIVGDPTIRAMCTLFMLMYNAVLRSHGLFCTFDQDIQHFIVQFASSDRDKDLHVAEILDVRYLGQLFCSV